MQFTALWGQLMAAGLIQPVAISRALFLAGHVAEHGDMALIPLEGYTLDTDLVHKMAGVNSELLVTCYLDMQMRASLSQLAAVGDLVAALMARVWCRWTGVAYLSRCAASRRPRRRVSPFPSSLRLHVRSCCGPRLPRCWRRERRSWWSGGRTCSGHGLTRPLLTASSQSEL